jgi:hypothetical protein
MYDPGVRRGFFCPTENDLAQAQRNLRFTWSVDLFRIARLDGDSWWPVWPELPDSRHFSRMNIAIPASVEGVTSGRK